MRAHCQTIEDTEPTRFPRWTIHHEYTTAEYIREEVSVRCPQHLTDFDQFLVIRHSQVSTRATLSLEVVRIE